MAKRYDICTPRKGRDDKTYWTRIGVAWEGDKGIQLVFYALPIPDDEGRCVARLFEPREDNRSGARDRQASQERAQPQYANGDDLDDSIPF